MSIPRTVLLLTAIMTSSVFAQTPREVDDDRISREILASIWKKPSLAAADIEVETRDGVVTLTGFAGTMEDIAAAGGLAQRVRGVSAVNNAIRVAIRPSRA